VLVKPLERIQDRIRSLELKEQFDLIVAVARGGVIPAMLLQARLGLELEWMWIHFRADDQMPVRPEPTLVRPLAFDPAGRSILVVDDRSSTGGTLKAARALLSGARLVRTLAVNGSADYSLFEDECFYFPWRMDIPPGTPFEQE